MGHKQFADPLFTGPTGHLFPGTDIFHIPFARLCLYHGMSLGGGSFPFSEDARSQNKKDCAPKAQLNYLPALETG